MSNHSTAIPATAALVYRCGVNRDDAIWTITDAAGDSETFNVPAGQTVQQAADDLFGEGQIVIVERIAR